MNANLSALLYLVAGVLFILSLRGLSSPASSRQGNLFGMIGMAIAVATTLANHPPGKFSPSPFVIRANEYPAAMSAFWAHARDGRPETTSMAASVTNTFRFIFRTSLICEGTLLSAIKAYHTKRFKYSPSSTGWCCSTSRSRDEASRRCASSRTVVRLRSRRSEPQ